MPKKQTSGSAGVPSRSTASGGKKPPYEPPKLMKFEKLERLIVSGE